MAISKGLDPLAVERGLTQWLKTKLPRGRVFDVSIPSGSGGSNETVFFTAAWQDNGTESQESMVARVLPTGQRLFPTYDLEREFRLIKTLAERTDVPVPDVHWLELDASVIGAPFIAMPCVEGRTLGDDPPFTAAGWFIELTAEEQARLHDNGLRAMAQIHGLDPTALGLEFLEATDAGPCGLAAQLAYWERFLDWAAEGETYPTIQAALDWVHRNLPGDEPTVLSWGDARLGNIIFADDLSVAAVLDWEMAGLVSPELDLGWWLFLNRHHTDGVGLPRPAGLPTDEETVRRYEELTGHRVRNLHFYLVFAGLRMSMLMVRVARLMIACGIVPPDSPMPFNNPASQMLADLLELPKPDADQTTSFAGVFTERDSVAQAG
jgi:aminoglycoside phosphotransferase (APT) family kinase protein